MRCFAGTILAAALCLAGLLAGTGRAGAEVVIAINKSSQRMEVVVDSVERYLWKVSTGIGGGPPSGSYRPKRMERKWYSRKYNWSPMPNAIFFHKGYAIHGTYYVSRLGQRASHGCVRLLPDNAAALFELVLSRGMRSTTIVVSNADYRAAVAGPAIAAATTSAEPAAPASRAGFEE